MGDFAISDQRADVRPRVELDADVLATVRRSLVNLAAPQGEERMTPVALDSGVGVKASQRYDPIGAVASLLFELAKRRGLRILAGLHHSAWNLQCVGGDAEAE